MVRVADHGVRFQCPCGGRMLGVAPFERLLDDGVGARLYVASADGDQAGPCPFCSRPMRSVPETADGPPGVAVCRLCEQVWLPADVESWMAAHAAHAAASTTPTLMAEPTRCEGCGAPWAPDTDGRCRYCRAQLTAPEPVVVTMGPARRPADGLAGAIATLLR
jgi:hypothetical protein